MKPSRCSPPTSSPMSGLYGNRMRYSAFVGNARRQRYRSWGDRLIFALICAGKDASPGSLLSAILSPALLRESRYRSELGGSEPRVVAFADGCVVAIDRAGRARCQTIQARRHQYQLAALTEKGAPIKLAMISVAVLAVVACFAFVGGWLSPGRLTQARMIDGFQEVNGVHPGFRRSHAKGVCIVGYFDSNGEGVRLSKAAVFRPGRIPVIGRLSLAGGQPYVSDGPAAVRAMGLSLRPPGGEEWRMAMIDIPVSSKTPRVSMSNCPPRGRTPQPENRTCRK
jgi:hypothetical protein